MLQYAYITSRYRYLGADQARDAATAMAEIVLGNSKIRDSYIRLGEYYPVTQALVAERAASVTATSELGAHPGLPEPDTSLINTTV